MISNVRGIFSLFDASIYTTDKDFTTVQVDIWIDAASINTGDGKRDADLKAADFLMWKILTNFIYHHIHRKT